MKLECEPYTLVGPGFKGKPILEQAKIAAVLALVGTLVFFSHPRPALFVPGLVVVGTGLLIRVWAAGHLARDQRLTTSGPYAHVRHPFYLGRLFLLVGFALLSGLNNLMVGLLCGFSLAFFAWAYLPRKERRENARLEELFGDEFAKWRAQVPGLFPRLRPYPQARAQHWSWWLFFAGDGTYPGNKELPTLLVALGLVGLFYWRMQTQK